MQVPVACPLMLSTAPHRHSAGRPDEYFHSREKPKLLLLLLLLLLSVLLLVVVAV